MRQAKGATVRCEGKRTKMRAHTLGAPGGPARVARSRGHAGGRHVQRELGLPRSARAEGGRAHGGRQTKPLGTGAFLILHPPESGKVSEGDAQPTVGLTRGGGCGNGSVHRGREKPGRGRRRRGAHAEPRGAPCWPLGARRGGDGTLGRRSQSPPRAAVAGDLAGKRREGRESEE